MIRSVAGKTMWVGRTLTFFVLGVLVAASIGLLFKANPAHAETFTVNSMDDEGDVAPSGVCNTVPFQREPECTLRAAIEEANANEQSDTINFHSALSGAITLSLGQLVIYDDIPGDTDDLIIQGPGGNKITVSGNDASRAFQVDFAGVTISGLTISDGRADFGGGIYNRSGTLTLTNSTVSGNAVGDDGGGIRNDGLLTLTNSTVSGNTADFDGTGSAEGGGIDNYGGGLTLTNSTVSGNTADRGGGIFNDGVLTLTNSTVSGNTAEWNGGGIYSFNSVSPVTLTNTIVARNAAFTSPDTQGTFTSGGNNLIGNTTGSSGFVASDLQNIDPLLGSLQDNGGPTNTHALLPGSPAVDAANNTACQSTDQRGVTRRDGDGDGSVICDIGAFERNDLTPPKVTTTTPTGKQVSPRANVTATFSEVMDEATVEAAGTFTLKKKGSNNALSATVTYDPATRRATLDPTNKLRSGATYIATVTTAAKDPAGNALDQNSSTAGDQPKSWRFEVR